MRDGMKDGLIGRGGSCLVVVAHVFMYVLESRCGGEGAFLLVVLFLS